MVERAATVAGGASDRFARRKSMAMAALAVVTLVSSDVLISLLAFLFAFKFRNHAYVFARQPGALIPEGFSADFQPYLTVFACVPFVKLYLLRKYGLYKLRGEFAFSSDFARLLRASTISFMVLVLIAFLFRQGFTVHHGRLTLVDFSYSRLVFVIDWIASIALFGLIRVGARTAQVIYRSTGRNLIRTVVVGCDEMAQVCIQEISQKPRLGYKLLGVVAASDDDDTSPVKGFGARILGEISELPALVKRLDIEEVFITDSRINPSQLFEILMECGRDHHIKYRVVPNLFNCLPGKTEIATVGTLPMIKLYEEPLHGAHRALKRGMDVTASILALIATWPVWVALAILIKLESKGPIFYKQERVGMDGKMFLMIKFRSMRDGADQSAHVEVMEKMLNGDHANQGTESEPIFGKVKDDPRVTRLGKWMRRYSVDELPQVLNVLLGQMSWVGPRPPIPYEVRLYKEWHRARFHVKPGITGLWQVSGRNRLHFEEMVRLDIFYMENWSPWLDLKILVKTIPVVLRGDNTY